MKKNDFQGGISNLIACKRLNTGPAGPSVVKLTIYSTQERLPTRFKNQAQSHWSIIRAVYSLYLKRCKDIVLL